MAGRMQLLQQQLTVERRLMDKKDVVVVPGKGRHVRGALAAQLGAGGTAVVETGRGGCSGGRGAVHDSRYDLEQK